MPQKPEMAISEGTAGGCPSAAMQKNDPTAAYATIAALLVCISDAQDECRITCHPEVGSTAPFSWLSNHHYTSEEE